MAIAFVAAADLGNNGGGGAYTVAYTVGSGANRALVVTAEGDTTSDLITGATYSGVSMTLLGKHAPGTSNGRWIYQFLLLAPASGSNNVVISNSSNCYILAGAADYTGVAQSGQPDATTTGTQAGVGNVSPSLTTSAANTWGIVSIETDFGGTPAAGTGATRRVLEGSFSTFGYFDSNGDWAAGSNSMTITGCQAPAWVISALAPAGGGPSARGLFQPSPVTGIGVGGSGYFRDPLGMKAS